MASEILKYRKVLHVFLRFFVALLFSRTDFSIGAEVNKKEKFFVLYPGQYKGSVF